MKKRYFTRKDKIFFIGQALVIIGIISYFFYRSLFAFFLLFPYVFFHLKHKEKEKKEQYQEKLQYQFQDGILAVSSALNAGYSVENAFYEARKDLRLLYQEQEPIMEEFSKIIKGLEANERIEKLLNDFARRSKLEDVESFAAVFETAKHWGGDFSLIISGTTDKISGKMEVMREIKTLISAKYFDTKIMKCIPFFIMLYIELTSPGFFRPMYGNITGNFIMTVCLFIYIFSCFLTKKIMKIQI